MIGRRCSSVLPADVYEQVLRAPTRPCSAASRGTSRSPTARTTARRWSRSPAADGAIAGALALAGTRARSCAPSAPRRRELARRLAQQAAVARLGELALHRPPLEELDGRHLPARWSTASEVELSH